MAAAFHPDDRTHPPLTEPLEDLHPAFAHKKLRWPTSAPKLVEFTDANRGVDYSYGCHQAHKGDDDLIVLNIYRTKTTPASYGIGPSPLLPIYIHHHIPHPADTSAPPGRMREAVSRLLPSSSTHPTVDKLANLVGAAMGREQVSLAALQYVLERRGVPVERNYDLGTGLDVPLALDVSSPTPTPANEKLEAILALRWSSEFVEARISAACTSAKHRNSTNTMKLTDVPAAKIHWNPRFTPIDRPKNHTPVFATVEELVGTRGVDITFSSDHSDGREGVFAFVWEGETWRLVATEVVGDSNWNREGEFKLRAPRPHPKTKMKTRGIPLPSPPPPMLRNSAKSSPSAKAGKVHAHVVHLYGHSHKEPVLTADLVTGQMWLVDSLHINLLDVAMVLLGAVMNLEQTVRTAIEKGEKERTAAVLAWRREMEKISIRC